MPTEVDPVGHSLFSKGKKDDSVRVLKFQTGDTERKKGRVLVASGAQSRNRDFWTGKPYRLVPAGMRLENWKKNPLLFYMHYMGVPLATGEMFLEDAKLWAWDDFKFHRKKIPVFSFFGGTGEFDTSAIADLWEDGFLNAVSIHIILSREDEKTVIETEDEILIPTSEVIEASVVTLPGDPHATREEEEAFIAEFADRMMRKGVPKEMAECVACNFGGSFELPTPTLNSFSQSAGNGGLVYPVSKPEDVMDEIEELVEETSPAVEEAAEQTPVEAPAEEIVEELSSEELPIEQEDKVTVLEFDLIEAIAQDEEVLFAIAAALVNTPEFVEGIAAALDERNVEGEFLEAAPLRTDKIILKLVNSGQRVAEPIEQQVARPAKTPIAIQQAVAAPVALPGESAKKRRKPSVLDLVRNRA